MSVSLLTTKLFIPKARPDRVARPRLLARLGDLLQPDCKIALLCAPAGFGKTSLLADWASQVMTGSHLPGGTSDEPSNRAASSGTVTWLSLDASDDDPIRFWTPFDRESEKHCKPLSWRRSRLPLTSCSPR
jgi:LuxR family maltose regulon positive regulatory protein